MNDLRKAAEMALEFCEHIHRCIGSGSATIHWDSATWHQNDATIEALRQVLAQPPVAYRNKVDVGTGFMWNYTEAKVQDANGNDLVKYQELYL